MRHNSFGQPLPATGDEIFMVVQECLITVDTVFADLFPPDPEETQEHFQGWTAEVRRNQDGETLFTTCGFPDKDNLVLALAFAGITDWHECSN